jgi:hypothetical protein
MTQPPKEEVPAAKSALDEDPDVKAAAIKDAEDTRAKSDAGKATKSKTKE